MSKELSECNEKELKFIELLCENGGNLAKAGEDAGYHPQYSWKLRERLAKAIIEAAENYLAMSSVRAASKLVNSIDMDMPNPIHVTAATAVLDRVGIIKRDTKEVAPVIKANIFILPEKRFAEMVDDMIDVTPT